MIKNKICQRCGVDFVGYHNAKYCPDCRPLAYLERQLYYDRAHAEQRKRSQLKWRLKNPSKVRNYYHKWSARHREELNAKERERYRRKCIERWKEETTNPTFKKE